MDRNAEAKKALAARAANIIENGDSLFLDVGSTTAYVAQALQNHQDLYVVTNSIAVAHILTARNNNRVFMAGGELRANDGGAYGQDALDFIQRFTVRYAIMSLGAISAEGGLMLHGLEEADITCDITARAQMSIAVADSSKFGMRCPISLRKPDDFDMLITNEAPDEAIKAMLDRHEISLVVQPA